MFHDSIHCCVRTCANRTSLVIYEYVDIYHSSFNVYSCLLCLNLSCIYLIPILAHI